MKKQKKLKKNIHYPGGKPLTLITGTSDNKLKRKKSIDPLTVEDLVELQTDIDAADKTMGIIMSKVQKRMGRKAIVPNAKKKLIDTGRRLDDFYDVKRVPFEVKRTIEEEEGEEEKSKSKKKTEAAEEEEKKGKGKQGTRGKAKGMQAKKEQQNGKKSEKGPKKKARGGKVKKETVWKDKDIVFPKDTSALIQHGIRERGLDPTTAKVLINMDFGQQFLKCTATIFDPSEQLPDLVDSDDEDDDDDEEDYPDLIDSDDDVDDDDVDDDDDDDDDEDAADGDEYDDIEDNDEDENDEDDNNDVVDHVDDDVKADVKGKDIESGMNVDGDDHDDCVEDDDDRVHDKSETRASGSKTKDKPKHLNSG